MFNKILIPLDGSPLAERALAPALTLAREPGTEVLLFRVAYPEQIVVPEHGVAGARGVVWPEQAAEYSRREAETYLSALQSTYASPTHLVWAKVAVVDAATPDVATQIVDTARAQHSDLIVMSSHGRSGMERWMFGSVAERVLSAAHCPVLVVRGERVASNKAHSQGEADQGGFSNAPVARGERPLRHILIPLDGSDLAERALEPGITVAARLKGTVTLLQVVPTVRRSADPEGRVTYHFFGRGASGSIKLPPKFQVGQSLQDNLHDEALTYLERVRARYARLGADVRTAAEVGPAAEAILAHVDAHGVDCVAMATHGHTGLRRWIYGSVMHKVLQGGHTAMLVIRPALN